MSKKTTKIILCGIAGVFVIAAILIIALSSRNSVVAPVTSGESNTSDVLVSDIETDEPSVTDVVIPSDDETSDATETNEPTPITDEPDEVTIPEETRPEPVETTKEPAGQVADPITEKSPVVIPDDDPADFTPETMLEYNCGSPGHHCDGPETHAYILNLEIEGCPYCKMHVCPSFYAVDEWGNTCYTPSMCPKYDVHSDPVYYCQTCGRKCGDGRNDTCVQFVNACNCPNCGEWVESFTCHTCK